MMEFVRREVWQDNEYDEMVDDFQLAILTGLPYLYVRDQMTFKERNAAIEALNKINKQRNSG